MDPYWYYAVVPLALLFLQLLVLYLARKLTRKIQVQAVRLHTWLEKEPEPTNVYSRHYQAKRADEAREAKVWPSYSIKPKID